MEMNEQILKELQQINFNLTKLIGLVANKSVFSGATELPSKTIGSEIKEKIRKARQEAEDKISRMKSGMPGI